MPILWGARARRLVRDAAVGAGRGARRGGWCADAVGARERPSFVLILPARLKRDAVGIVFLAGFGERGIGIATGVG